MTVFLFKRGMTLYHSLKVCGHREVGCTFWGLTAEQTSKGGLTRATLLLTFYRRNCERVAGETSYTDLPRHQKVAASECQVEKLVVFHMQHDCLR